MSTERADWHVDNWAQWMHGRGTGLGYPSRASGRMGKSGSTDFDQMVASADVRCAVAVDALIDGMTWTQRKAIYSVKLGNQWTSPLPLDDVYQQALSDLAAALTRRGIM
jgi:hypothetical protein